MEIINTTLVNAGNNITDWIFLAILGVLGMVAIVIAISAIADREVGLGIVSILLGLFALSVSIGIFIDKRNTEPYNKYDVIFTGEEINMKEFLDKYTITGHDGNIWHLEDNH